MRRLAMTVPVAPPRIAERVEPPLITRSDTAFRRVNIAMFIAGLATFGLLYCVQPVMPDLARAFGLSPAGASLSLSAATGDLAVR